MPGPHRPRLLNGLLGLVVALITLSAVGFSAWEASVRLRADTATQAVMTGEPGCVTAAEFNAPDGSRQVVSLRRYKGNCIDAQPGRRVTVYYDRDDPSVHTRSRRWWWSALLALVMLPLAYLGVRTVQRSVRPARFPRPPEQD